MQILDMLDASMPSYSTTVLWSLNHDKCIVVLSVPLLQGGHAPPNICLGLPILVFLKILFLKHHAMTRQQTMIEKGIIAFKHNSPLTFS